MAIKAAVIGVGLVGETIVSCLKERNFPCEWPPRMAATRERVESVNGERVQVVDTTAEVFKGMDLVLFAGKEGGSGASVTWRETEKKVSPDEVREMMRNAPGVKLIDDVRSEPIGEQSFPTNLDVNRYPDDVMVGRIREDSACENGIAMWIVADNLRKGAALNVVQVAEELVRKGML